MDRRMMDTATAARALDGRLIGANVAFARVTTDSRALAAGDLFVALKGERFDGHAFVASALAGGAAAAMVAAERADGLAGNLIAVADPLAGLARLAGIWRARFDIPVLLVVGSNGKTTVKEMIASILRAHFGDDAVLATQGNLNNAIGLPLTLTRLSAGHRAAVVELGMNHRGETRALAAIASPTIVVINNAQREHQEFMAGVAEVAAEHADAIGALRPRGTAVINADDDHAQVWRTAARDAGVAVVDFGFGAAAQVSARSTPRPDGSSLELRTGAGATRAELHVPGRHMVGNALAACAATLAAGVPLDAVVRGLEAFRAVAGRLCVLSAASGARVIDDTYNANPDSVRAAIDVLAGAAGPRWLVLGDMGEVGAEGPAFHREIGAYAKASGIERLLATGELAREAVAAFGTGALHAESVEALALRVRADAKEGVTLLVKGSRFMRMERVVAALAGTPCGAAH
jgi:UDP-N-acetylmuramoyl-tripeptide--D-alanyl-D-alanine ligase